MNLLKFQFAFLFAFMLSSSLLAQNWSPFKDSPQEYLRKGNPEEALRMMKSNPKWISLGDGKGFTPLHYAVSLGNRELVEWLLDNGADVNAAANKNQSISYSASLSRANEILQKPHGDTALIFAKTPEMAKFLLERGADINAVNAHGETPLFLTQSLEVAKHLIANLPNLDQKDNFGQTALQSISKSIDDDDQRTNGLNKDEYRRVRSAIAYALIEAGANYDLDSAIYLGDMAQVKRSYRKGDKDEYSDALKTAVSAGQAEICRYLFDLEAIDFSKPLDGYDSLFYCTLRHPKVLKLFIENGAEVNSEIQLSGGMSGMHIIAFNALVVHHAVNINAPPESIKLLLDAGADPFDECEGIGGMDDDKEDLVSPMDVACFHSGFYDNSETILALVSHPKFQMDEKRERQELFDRYLFMFPVMEKSHELVTTLIEKGANPLIKFKGFSTLQANWLSYELIGGKDTAELNQGCFNIAKLLIENGLKQDLITSVMFGDHVSVKNLLAEGERLKEENQFIAIGICIKERRPKILLGLLESGIKIEEGPLVWAATMGQENIVEMLLDHGADVNENDRFFGTPLHRAVMSGHTDIIKLLLKNGADLEAKDGKGKTPIEACDNAERRIEFQKIIDSVGSGN